MDRKLQEEETAEDIEQLESAEEEARALALLGDVLPKLEELEGLRVNPYNRIRMEGLHSTLKERAKDYDLADLEAEVELEEETKFLLTKRITSAVKKIIKPVATTCIIATFSYIGYTIVDEWWNANEYAVEALSKYDQPIKITDIKERKEVASLLDEIFEEHAKDKHSDSASETYLTELENRDYSITKGATILNEIGSKLIFYNANELRDISLAYMNFIKEKNISLEKSKYY